MSKNRVKEVCKKKKQTLVKLEEQERKQKIKSNSEMSEFYVDFFFKTLL